MTTRYATFRENAGRRPVVPCFLTPPLREVFYQHQGFVPHLPLVGCGRIFLAHRASKTVALDEKSTKPVWSGKKGGTPVALVGCHVVDYAEEVQLLDAAAGFTKGRIPVEGGNTAELGEHIVAHRYGTYDTLSCARLDADEALWVVRLGKGPETSTERILGVFGASGDLVIVGRENGTAAGVRLANGRERWRTELTIRDPSTGEITGEIQGAIVVRDDRALLEVWPWGACALSLESGAVLWRWVGHVPVQAYLYDDRYYILGQAGQFFVLDPDTGKVLQRSRLGEQLPPKARKEVGTICDPMLVSESHLWVGSETGHVVAFERDGLGYAWHGRPKKAASTHFQGSAFISVNGRLYYGDQTFGIHCLEEVNPTDPQLAAWRAEDEAKKKGWFRR